MLMSWFFAGGRNKRRRPDRRPDRAQEHADLSASLDRLESRTLLSTAVAPVIGERGPRLHGNGQREVVGPVRASVPHGFYDAPFALELSTPTAGAEIRYTLDGSEPTADHGAVYTGPITIDRTTILRAAAFKAGYLRPADDAQTYLFLDDVLQAVPRRAGAARLAGELGEQRGRLRDGPGDRQPPPLRRRQAQGRAQGDPLDLADDRPGEPVRPGRSASTPTPCRTAGTGSGRRRSS